MWKWPKLRITTGEQTSPGRDYLLQIRCALETHTRPLQASTHWYVQIVETPLILKTIQFCLIHLKYHDVIHILTIILKCNNISQHYRFHSVFDQINVALGSKKKEKKTWNLIFSPIINNIQGPEDEDDVPYHEQFVSTSQHNQNRSFINIMKKARARLFIRSSSLLFLPCRRRYAKSWTSSRATKWRFMHQANTWQGQCVFPFIYMSYFYLYFHVCVTVQHKKVIASTIDHFSHGRLRNS